MNHNKQHFPCDLRDIVIPFRGQDTTGSWSIGFTLRIQLIATAAGVALFLETPTELKRVCVVKTPIAPPKKCYQKWKHNQYSSFKYQNSSEQNQHGACTPLTLPKQYLVLVIPSKANYEKHLQSSPCHIRHIRWSYTLRKAFWYYIGSYERHQLLQQKTEWVNHGIIRAKMVEPSIFDIFLLQSMELTLRFPKEKWIYKLNKRLMSPCQYCSIISCIAGNCTVKYTG